MIHFSEGLAIPIDEAFMTVVVVLNTAAARTADLCSFIVHSSCVCMLAFVCDLVSFLFQVADEYSMYICTYTYIVILWDTTAHRSRLSGWN